MLTAPRQLPRFAATTAFAALAFVTLTGCAGATAAADPAPKESATDTPVVIDNCGTAVTIDVAPQRIITIKSSTLELALALGAGDRIIGSAFSDGPVPKEFAAAAADIPVISDKVPSQEATLALNPDLIFGGWESNFSADGAGERAALSALGVNTYVPPAACREGDYMPNPLTFDDVFASFIEAGQVLGEELAAEELVVTQQEQLAALKPDARKLSAIWYSSGGDAPFVGAGIGAPAMIMSHAGLINAFADVEDSWVSTSWEKVAELNPDVFVLVDAPWNPADEKIARLEANPATARLDAVVNKRYLVLEFPATESGIRSVGAVSSLIDQLEQK